jgi:hypothetical protein
MMTRRGSKTYFCLVGGSTQRSRLLVLIDPQTPTTRFKQQQGSKHSQNVFQYAQVSRDTRCSRQTQTYATASATAVVTSPAAAHISNPQQQQHQLSAAAAQQQQQQ